MFLNEGVVEEEGSPEDVFDRPKSDRLRQFLHATSQTKH
jgi:ABC-type histidine transport system ATPase subunit